MKHNGQNDSSYAQRRQLLILCRFLSVRASYRFMLLLLSSTGLILSIIRRTQFAPYGIALVCLILPSFLANSVKEKESGDSHLSALYKRYHYSPVMFSSYRITVTLCAALLFAWHMVQTAPLTLFGVSVALLYLVLILALPLLLSRILFLLFHRRLMRGTM